MQWAAVVLAVFVAAAAAGKDRGGKPNIVFFLTDDQDQMLGGSFPAHNGITPMKTAQAELVEKGAMALQHFIHTPICCPSRSELLTGRYFHNVKGNSSEQNQCLSNYGVYPCCMHCRGDIVLQETLATHLSAAGYTVGMAGKLLNNNPDPQGPPIAGFDFYMANGGGEYFAPEFQLHNADFYNLTGKTVKFNQSVYTTSIVGNITHAWLEQALQGDKPIMAYIAPKACHEPFSPAPWYADYWAPEWPAHEPRPVSWNCSFESRKDHHHVIATEPLISDAGANFITQSFKDRWRTLMSVDDVIRDTMALFEAAGEMDNTYFFFSSDHGFQLGEFNLPIDKRHVYDFDIRIHALFRGPGIPANSTWDFISSNVDVAPTFLGLAGLKKPASMDGKSIVPLVVKDVAAAPPATQAHIREVTGDNLENYKSNWRDSMFIEYYYVENNTKCIPECHNIEDPSNNFIGIRHLGGEFGDTSYTEYQTSLFSNISFDKIDFVEYFNLTVDPWQMNNLYQSVANSSQIQKLHEKLHMWYKCQGDACP